ncbi:transcription elongation factor TFIIS [Lodderomyces elongisporus]|uniref:transcription elongation factor TFIIS n=1 Tax=Lodderomyces elongisporus TaxID=36914 RepID=UPI00291D243F|nr:transcription elongation factor TFIIS [Lodderomyces elongisporus]WLF77841.1 transcription elongation factor TFIIS [Lodderomyces elongisporus]
MDSKEVKSTVSNLEKTKDDATILKLLNILNDEVQPTEKLLRETKVGIAVNKYRTHSNAQVSSLVKKMIRGWRDAVQAEKESKKKASASSSSSSSLSSSAAGAGAASTSASTSASSTTASATTAKGASNDTTSSASGPSLRSYTGPRDAKKDGVNTQLYDNDTRNASVVALYASLAVDREDPSKHIVAVAAEIESAVFKNEYSKVNEAYRNKLRTFVMQLRNKKNPELRERLLTRQITAERFIKMSPNEMAPEELKKEIEKMHKQNLFDAQGATEKRAVTDRFTCGKCKHKKVSYYQMQTRSADEPLTTFCTCENCGNRWKFS